MNGSKRFKDAPDPIEVSCYHCKLIRSFSKHRLKEMGTGPDAPLPDLIHGLARLLNCERAKALKEEKKSKPCMLRYENLSDSC